MAMQQFTQRAVPVYALQWDGTQRAKQEFEEIGNCLSPMHPMDESPLYLWDNSVMQLGEWLVQNDDETFGIYSEYAFATKFSRLYLGTTTPLAERISQAAGIASHDSYGIERFLAFFPEFVLLDQWQAKLQSLFAHANPELLIQENGEVDMIASIYHEISRLRGGQAGIEKDSRMKTLLVEIVSVLTKRGMVEKSLRVKWLDEAKAIGL